ncbi:MAG: DedA family protein [Bacteroidetes bacterium]|nr:DedA family protein [Bacteroidota bacterium]
MFVQLGYWGLLLSSFLSSTVIPLSSEVALVALLAMGLDPVLCVLTATVGNSLGGMTSYGLGYLGKWEWIEMFFKTPKHKVERFQHRIGRYGAMAGLFAWLPIVGDLIALGLGFMKLNPWLSCLYMFVGRLVRFSVVGGLMQLF